MLRLRLRYVEIEIGFGSCSVAVLCIRDVLCIGGSGADL